MKVKKKAEASTPFWFQAFGFLLVVIAFVAMGSWGINAFGATDNLNNVISEATLDNFINSLTEFEDSDDAKRSIDITLAENAALIYYAPGKDFKFQIQSNLPTKTGSGGVDIIRDNFGRSSEFPLECPPNEPCICICTEARGSSNIECSQKICKKSPSVFNETHVLKDVFSQDYEYSESSWEGGFLIASNHELIGKISSIYNRGRNQYYGEIEIKSFAGITMPPTKKSSAISLLLEKNSDDKISIKWGDDIN